MADDFTAGAGVGDRIEDVVRAEVKMLVPPSPPCYGVTESVLVQGIHPRPLPAYLSSARADLPAPVAAPCPLVRSRGRDVVGWCLGAAARSVAA
jgi:hypothetical protein